MAYSQAFGYKFYFQIIKGSVIDLTKIVDGNGIGTGTEKFMDISTLLSNTSAVAAVGTGSTFKIIAGSSKAVTKAAATTAEATLTFAAAHGFAVGSTVAVQDLPSPFAALNGVFTVKAATTSAPFTLTYDLVGTAITEATVAAGTVTGTALKLDGTDPPIRLLGLTNLPTSEGESEETVQTYDDESRSFDTSIATGKSYNVAVGGVIDQDDAAYRLMRIASKRSVEEGLMIKFAKIGPRGKKETTFGYGRFTGFEESNEAGSIVKFTNQVKGYGPYGIDWSVMG
jgi:hypothetical protein